MIVKRLKNINLSAIFIKNACRSDKMRKYNFITKKEYFFWCNTLLFLILLSSH